MTTILRLILAVLSWPRRRCELMTGWVPLAYDPLDEVDPPDDYRTERVEDAANTRWHDAGKADLRDWENEYAAGRAER